MGANTFEADTANASLTGKVIFVTGGNAGLGARTIQNLASRNPARIYLAARTASKAATAISAIQSAVPNACEIVHIPLDLTSFASISAAAKEFRARESRLDILMLNAGIMACPYELTTEGYETQLGTNHVGHALLAKLLLPVLLATAEEPGADVRVITLSSIGHHLTVPGGIEFDQKKAETFWTWKRYGASKLANILFASELAERYPQITSVSLHPGVIFTDLFNTARSDPLMGLGLWFYGLLFPLLPGHFKDTEGGARNQTWAALAPKERLESGAFYHPGGKKKSGSKWAQDVGLRKKLWEWTEAEFGRHGY